MTDPMIVPAAPGTTVVLLWDCPPRGEDKGSIGHLEVPVIAWRIKTDPHMQETWCKGNGPYCETWGEPVLPPLDWIYQRVLLRLSDGKLLELGDSDRHEDLEQAIAAFGLWARRHGPHAALWAKGG